MQRQPQNHKAMKKNEQNSEMAMSHSVCEQPDIQVDKENETSESAETEEPKRRKKRSKEEMESEESENPSKKGSRSKSNATSFKSVTKGSIWDLQENDVISMLKYSEREADFFETFSHYVTVIKYAFFYETYNPESKPQTMMLEKQGYKLANVKVDGNTIHFGIKKKSIKRITDFSYENIHHITAAKMLDVIANNFGGGWESISQSIKDIIESGFDVSTTTLPTDRLKLEGGMYANKIADGFEVLEIPRGAWTEAIFAKVKPIIETPKMQILGDEFDDNDIDNDSDMFADDIDMNNEDVDDMTEDNYRTIFAEGGGEEDEEGEDIYGE